MDVALRFATSCARAYQRASEPSRKLFNSAVLERVVVRNGHVTEAEYKEPFDELFSEPKFEYEDLADSNQHPTPLMRHAGAHALCHVVEQSTCVGLH